MFNPEEKSILHNYGQLIVEQLQLAIRTKPVTKYGVVNSSGNLAKSVRYEVTDSKLIIYAADYIYQVNRGRAPGKFPPIDAIKDWIDNKGLSYDIPINSLAFLIARSIANKGTTAWQQGGTDIVEDVITPTLLEEIRQDFTEAVVKRITSEIIDSYLLAA